MDNGFLWPPDLEPRCVKGPMRPQGTAAPELRLVGHTGSTNDWSLDSPARNWQWVVADAQIAGRGRRGRKWISPSGGISGGNLYASALIPQNSWRASPGWLPLMGGVALIRGLSRLGVRGLALKWPNDLLLPTGEKLAGILVESGRGTWKMGMGVNVGRAPHPQASSLLDLGYAHVGRGPLLGSVARELSSLLRQRLDSQGEPLRSAWEAEAWLDGEVQVHPPSGPPWTGRALGLDAEGRLRVQGAAGVSHLSGADCSLVLA